MVLTFLRSHAPARWKRLFGRRRLGFGVPREFPVCHPETSKETGDLSGTSPLNRQVGTWGHPEKPVSSSDLTMRSQKGWFVKDS